MKSKKFQHALITGASSGIGARVAVELAAEGTHVVLAARRKEALEQVAEEIRAAGGRADVTVLDVADPHAVMDQVKRWDERTDGLDLVLANAGVGRMKPAHKLTWEQDIEPVLAVNVNGAFATLLAAVQCMVPRGRGTISGVSSLAAMRGLPASGAYSASKAALSTFLETLRTDLTSKGIDVVDIRPGFVRTPMTENNRTPMPMLMEVNEAARHIVQGLHKGMAVVAFPWPMATAMSLAQSAPDALWRKIAPKIR